jgi:hypothetical protein
MSSMTQQPEKATAAGLTRPDPDQDALAAVGLDEIAAEARWSALFAQSQGALEKLAIEAVAEHVSGKTRPS